MDERFIENSEAVIAAELESKVGLCSRKAFQLVSEFVREDCGDCGAALIEFRKQRGLLRCMECQSAVERRSSQVRARVFED